MVESAKICVFFRNLHTIDYAMRPLLLFLLFFSTPVFGQKESHYLIFCDTLHCDFSKYMDSLSIYEERYASNHKITSDDQNLKLAYYVALSHYPELKDACVKLKPKSLSSTMQAQPRWDFLFRSKRNRNYKIFVNTDENNTGITYRDLSFNSLVGWIGHEMAHLTEYAQKDNVELLSFIASYVMDNNELKRTEHKADKLTIQHGLGAQLLEGVNFFHRNRKVKHAYREKNRKYYLSAEEIVADINQLCSKK
jgi:hypothetical protein